jgi:DNA polymerase III subunit gamma/tau
VDGRARQSGQVRKEAAVTGCSRVASPTSHLRQSARAVTITKRPMATAEQDQSYRVLARKYRPTTFTDLFVGQGAMVRTLGNAFQTGRIAQAFILTGVRGIGKTTTARIIARALNCVGEDGSGGPTIDPCGVCEHCKAIGDDRHVDVIEIDAASHTGVDNIREIIDNVRYLPATARYKIYIIDEVHMLSKPAFNALLKTLEEPPPHVKFVFATTEIRKVPVTVLSRCQRFDLRRLDSETLIAHLGNIAKQEDASADIGALGMIARAAEGSVRDALSLLDQALAFSDGTVTEESVQSMLGLADRARLIDLFEKTMGGEIGDALGIARELYELGTDPVTIVQDLLEFVHWLTRLKVTRAAADDLTATEVERVRGQAMAEKLTMGELTRTWQLLLKGLQEVLAAPTPYPACEMVLVRIGYAAALPPPADLIRTLQDGGTEKAPGTSPAAQSAAPASGGGGSAQTASGETVAAPAAARAEPVPEEAPDANAVVAVSTFQDVIDLAETRTEYRLRSQLVTNVHLVRMEPRRIDLRLNDRAPPRLPQQLSSFLSEATGETWLVSESTDPGDPTIQEQQETAVAQMRGEAERHPLVRAVLDQFPGAEIREVRDIVPPDAAGATEIDDETLEDNVLVERDS